MADATATAKVVAVTMAVAVAMERPLQLAVATGVAVGQGQCPCPLQMPVPLPLQLPLQLLMRSSVRKQLVKKNSRISEDHVFIHTRQQLFPAKLGIATTAELTELTDRSGGEIPAF